MCVGQGSDQISGALVFGIGARLGNDSGRKLNGEEACVTVVCLG